MIRAKAVFPWPLRSGVAKDWGLCGVLWPGWSNELNEVVDCRMSGEGPVACPRSSGERNVSCVGCDSLRYFEKMARAGRVSAEEFRLGSGMRNVDVPEGSVVTGLAALG